MTNSYTYRRSGTCGCEIIDADGSVVAWTVDAAWAGLIVAALNGACFPRPAPVHQVDGECGPVETAEEDRKRAERMRKRIAKKAVECGVWEEIK